MFFLGKSSQFGQSFKGSNSPAKFKTAVTNQWQSNQSKADHNPGGAPANKAKLCLDEWDDDDMSEGQFLDGTPTKPELAFNDSFTSTWSESENFTDKQSVAPQADPGEVEWSDDSFDVDKPSNRPIATKQAPEIGRAHV